MSSKTSLSSKVLQGFNALLPNCERAINVAELGQERPLSLKEKLSLKYNSRLCPFCACAETKVQSEVRKMNEAAEARRKG